MAWVLIDPTAVDVNSPIDEDLMKDKIKNNDDDHQGRILVLEASGGGGGAAGVDNLEARAPSRHIGSVVIDPPNSVLDAFENPQKELLGELLATYVSGTTIFLSWNNLFVEDADPDMDSTANWNLRFAATTLGTSGSAVIGANPISINKTTGNFSAAIDLDRGSQNFSIASHSKVIYFHVNLPSLTNLDTVDFYLKKDLSNYTKWSVSVDHTGAALSSGANLIKVDTTVAGTDVGTGFNPASDKARYIGLGVTSSSSAQLYTQIEFDGLRAQENDIEKFIQQGSEVSINDGTNLESDMVIAVSGTGVHGTVTLTGGLSNGYTAGSGTTFIKRNSLTVTGDNESRMVPGLSGDAAKSQAFRLQVVMPAILTSKDYTGTIATTSNCHWVVSEVTDSTHFKMKDPGALGVTEIVNNSTMIDFESVYNPHGKVSFVNRNADMAVTAATTNSAEISTVTVVATGAMEVGDIVHKNEIANLEFSAVGKNADESFSAMTAGNTQKVLINRGVPYVNVNNIFGHWFVGGSTNGAATKNRIGTAPNLTLNGTITDIKVPFFNGQFGANGFSGANFYSIAAASSTGIAGVSRLSGMGWTRTTGLGSGGSNVCTRNSSGNGWGIRFDHTAGTLGFVKGYSDTRISHLYPTDEWILWAFTIESGVSSFWLGNTKGTDSTSAIVDPVSDFLIGNRQGLAEPLISDDFSAEIILWAGGPELQTAQVEEAYNGGIHKIFGGGPGLIIRPTISAQTGQKISIRGDITRETDAAIPGLKWAGVING